MLGQGIKKVFDKREGIQILDGDGVQRAVVGYKAKFPVFISYKEYGGPVRRVGRPDEYLCRDSLRCFCRVSSSLGVI